MTRILVTGSRDWENPVLIARQVMAYINETCPYIYDERGPVRRDISDVVIVHGGCPTGADAQVEHFARGCRPPIRTEVHRADWRAHGKRAGIVRNEEMVEAGADVCLAFINPCRKDECPRREVHGSHGSVHCAGVAGRAVIDVRITHVVQITPVPTE